MPIETPKAATNGEKPRIRRAADEEEGDPAKYPHYLPVWDYSQKYPPLEPFTHHDPGKNADPSLKDLLPPGVATVKKLTPTIGTEITGVQLSSLSNAGKDQLALFAAQRKVLVFRDQDFADLPIEKAVEFGGYFGRHHIHPTTGSPEGYQEFNLVHQQRSSNGEFETFIAGKNSTVLWHSDVTYEEQPPGMTILFALELPEVGGDTAFANQVEAYRRLSPALKERLHGLKGVHSGVEQAEASARGGGIVRRAPVVTEHPIVRTHPVTGEKALFVNALTTRIAGLKKEESDALLGFLVNHIGRGLEYQVRVRWEPKTVVIWDNRVTAHTAIVDWTTTERRHLARLTPQAERPFETPYVPEE
ncbi:TauD/TfdA dioxygenase family protein [Aspergillus lucknowensis]|uniref:Laminin IV type B domain-containing protein n=1 Tax=Aspergillus lucknowensis TaxID=176173 RepID=A0ABR4LNQ9_9EURO